MAKKGNFTISYLAGAFSLESANFENPNIVPFEDPTIVPPPDVYRIKWVNAGNYADIGVVEGDQLAMHVGYVGHNYDAQQGITFRYGDSYIFSVEIYSVHSGWFGTRKWRRLKHTVIHTFEQAVVAPSQDDTPDPPLSPEKQPDWLTPILNQMMT